MNVCEGARPILCQKRTNVRIREPLGVKKEHTSYVRMRDPVMSNMNICEDARPVGVKKGRVCVIILSLPRPFILTYVSIWGRSKGEKAKNKGVIWVLLTESLKLFRLEIKWTSQTISVKVTLRLIGVNFVVVEKQSECVSSLIYPACKTHPSYYIVICGLSGCCILLSHIISQLARFVQKVLNVMSVVWFSLQILTLTSLILRRIQRGKKCKWTPKAYWPLGFW